jgi:hypothetical protein
VVLYLLILWVIMEGCFLGLVEIEVLMVGFGVLKVASCFLILCLCNSMDMA